MKKLVLTGFFLFSLLVISTAQTVYITKSGSKYHSADCSSLRKSSIPIELKDAIDRGYAPCSKCTPPTIIKQDRNKTSRVDSSKSFNTQSIVPKNSETESSGRCQARTQKGTQCKRKAQRESKYCWQHSK